MPPRSAYPGINKVTTRLSTGERVTYWYAWKGGPRLPGKPGDAEFSRAYREATETRTQPQHTGATLTSLSAAYQRSRGKRGSGKGFMDLARRTQLDYAHHLGIIEAKWGTLPIKAMGSQKFRGAVLDWRDKLSEKSERQADYTITVFARLLAWAVGRGRIKKNPLEKVGRIYAGTRADIVWTAEDEAAFIKSASEPLALAFNLALWTGQRMGDLLRLQWSAYDGDTIRLRQSKTGARIAVPVASQLRGILDAAPRRNLNILTNSAGQPWTHDGFRSSWRKVAKRAGIDGPSSGDLRGTAVTRLALAGCSHAEIASITGHSNGEVTDILDRHYLARDPEIAKSAIRKLEDRGWYK